MNPSVSRTPVFSVIMPLFNKRPYVRRAVESVLAQTFPHWELIVVDDGSSDGSCDEVPLEDGRVHIVRQENRGPGAARNRGAGLSLGQLLCFIDADDCYYPRKLETEYALLQADETVEWMMSAGELESDGMLSQRLIHDRQGRPVGTPHCIVHDALDRLTLAGWPIDGLCMKRTLFERVRGFDETMRFNEITELQVRCAVAQPRLLIHNEPLYRVVDVPGSAAKVSLHMIEGIRQIGESFHRLSREHPACALTLADRSRESFYSYAALLILDQRTSEARRFLSEEFPLRRDRRWWKLWLGSCLPSGVVRSLARSGRQQAVAGGIRP